MHLILSIVSFALCGYFLIQGFEDTSIVQVFIASIWMSIGRYNIKRYKENH